MTSIFQEAHDKASVAANEAAKAAAVKYFGSETGDAGACGFAWVKVANDGRSKIAKEVKKITHMGWRGEKETAFRKDWNYGYTFWNPSKWGGQNIDVKEAGARAYAETFKTEAKKMGYEVEMFAQSRMD